MSRDAMRVRTSAGLCGLLTVAIFAVAHPDEARAQACLEELRVLPAGELTMDGSAGEERLAFLRFQVADFLFDGVETLSSAAYVTGKTEGGRPYHVWSLSTTSKTGSG